MRKLQSTVLVIATHNKDKLGEFEAILRPHGMKTKFAGNLNLTFPPETEETFVGNARIKAHFVARETQLPAISDDSGIMVSDLDNKPGVKTADWAETPDGRDYKKAMTKVWKLLEEKQSPLPRRA
ncbi:MAG: non-canonical purine NTP pyrophosphatase, partial [Rhodobacteraceae bacterium]|nr:non-canonical purine NTP pyrophosphatase [Paracoccaceae bacterium]